MLNLDKKKRKSIFTVFHVLLLISLGILVGTSIGHKDYILAFWQAVAAINFIIINELLKLNDDLLEILEESDRILQKCKELLDAVFESPKKKARS